MKREISEKLEQIQADKKIKILFANESGSRAWGFPSPDSDYDVRFVYMRPVNYYLSVAERTDHLKFPINDELDIYGWDIRKVLQLIKKSNATPFEWLQSPIVYHEEEGFRDDLWQVCQLYFSKRINAYHYLGIAKGAMETIENEDLIKIKKLFYVLRPLLAAKWCIEKNTIAPMTIGPLMNLLTPEINTTVDNLIKLKETAAEGFVIKIENNLKLYIENEFKACYEGSKEIPKDAFAFDRLDDFFRKTLNKYDY